MREGDGPYDASPQGEAGSHECVALHRVDEARHVDQACWELHAGLVL